MQYVKLIAPAKVNLVLSVGKRSSDGFHSVDTIMHAFSLHDVLEMRVFEPQESKSGLKIFLSCKVDEGLDLAIAPEENIVYKAVVTLARALGRTEDEEIHMLLTKHIPHEAGLGGGSSDAAAALRGAALLWGIPEDDERVVEVARSLGADVPFFLKGGCAYMTGRGDVWVKNLVSRKDFCVLVRPDVGVSTKAAYAAFDKNPHIQPASYRNLLASLDDAADVEPYNNLSDAACVVLPELEKLFSWVKTCTQARQALLCGSGSAICVFCSSFEDAVRVSIEAQKQGYWARTTTFSRLGAQVVESF